MLDIDVGVTGIAKLSDTYYICYEDANQIHTFHTSPPYPHVSKICIDCVSHGDLRDVVASPVNQRLYTSDIGNSCIWRIDVNIDSTYAVSKFTDVDGNPRRLSVSPSGRLSVIEMQRNNVLIFDADGSQATTINTPNDLDHLHHAIEWHWGLLLISHGFGIFDKHRVCEISMSDASILPIHSYGDMCGTGEGQLFRPFYLAVCHENNTVFVADIENRRMVILDADLKQMDIISTGKFRPTSFLYDADSKNIFVADMAFGIKVIRQ